MNNRFRLLPLGTCLLILGAIGSALLAQEARQPTQAASQSTAASSTSGQGFRGVVDIPYSADRLTVTTQTLADGTTITQKHLVKEYRDGQGRERTEWFKPGVESVGQDDSPESVQIRDSMAGVIYSLNPRNRTAQRIEMRRPTPRHVPQASGASGDHTPARPVMPRPTVEDLGTQVIEGVEANGQRTTRTIPAGAEGNDQPIQITSESWYASKLRIPLVYITNDPRHGETVTRLTNLVLEEPPAELFQVPADYTLQELQPVAKPEPPSD